MLRIMGRFVQPPYGCPIAPRGALCDTGAMSQTLLTAREVGALLGKSRSQVNRDAKDGKIPVAERHPRLNLFEPSVIAQLLKERAS